MPVHFCIHCLFADLTLSGAVGPQKREPLHGVRRYHCNYCIIALAEHPTRRTDVGSVAGIAHIILKYIPVDPEVNFIPKEY